LNSNRKFLFSTIYDFFFDLRVMISSTVNFFHNFYTSIEKVFMSKTKISNYSKYNFKYSRNFLISYSFKNQMKKNTNYSSFNFFFFYFFNKKNTSLGYIANFFDVIFFFFTQPIINTKKSIKQTCGEGFFYIRGLFLIFFTDACVTDDEPLWEPIEWSLVQTWIFFIFIFAWVAENLITSRYGSYTGRDKRVWFAWYKSFWLLEMWYAVSYGSAALFVIVPFYYELTYNISFVFSWWNWYTRVFFFKFISLYSLILLISYFFQLNVRWLNWKKLVILVITINFFIGYLLYSHFIMSFFGYFTDPLWYQKTRFIDYIQLSHEPLKWGWGPSKRDHFTYHKVSTVFWFKNDGPFAGAFLMIHLFFFLSLFFLYLYWIILLRKVISTKELTHTFTSCCVSSLRQFFYFFFLFYGLIMISFLTNYWRFPLEFLWIINAQPWTTNFIYILADYPLFLLNNIVNV
jgi:hypothetical protein